MATNPFDSIELRLNNIESLLNDLKHLRAKSSSEIQPQSFSYIPIKDIFQRKLCSKPTFYKYLRAGDFTLYKFGKKSFVNLVEFEKAFNKVKLTHNK